jgi:glycosyltransferase involved in cell wall biosynthesis
MRVLHVLAPAPFGGLERVVHTLAVGQRDSVSQVRVLALLDAGAPEPATVAQLRDAGIDVRPIALRGRAYIRRWRAIRRECELFRPNVLHTHGYVSDVLSALLTVEPGVRKVSTAHGFGNGPWKERLYEWLQRRAYRRFDAVVAVSRQLASELVAAGVSPDRVHSIANALPFDSLPLEPGDARHALQVPPHAFSVGWVGRISREKALDVFLNALPALADLPLHVTIIGDGGERGANEAHARSLGISDRVSWRGVVPHAASLLRALDVIVISSRTEGTPIILLEAMSAGVPVVTTAVGGVPDVVTEFEAVLVRPENPRELGVALRSVHDDPEAAARRAMRGAERV